MVLPGGEMSGRPLHFFWITDCSGSMEDDKIQSLNTAIREAIPEMRSAARRNPHVNVLVRAIKFATSASWNTGQATGVENFVWTDLTAGGVTDMGKALMMVADELKIPLMDPRGLPPVLVLITDGHATDDVEKGIKAIMEQPWGRRAVRIAIGIGDDVDYNVLHRFIGHPEIPILQANNAEHLFDYIKWASTAVLQSASAPNISNSNASMSRTSGLDIPLPPPISSSPSSDIW